MKFIPHPAVLILLWVLLALLAQRLQPLPLLGLTAVLLGLALRLCAVQLSLLLRRTRWILFSLLLIYAYTTPGVPVLDGWGRIAPTVEGLWDGVLQLACLLSMLASLAILLAIISRSQLIGGLYVLLYPLRWCGLSRERVAVRLALTLEHAEPAMRDTAQDWRSSLEAAMRCSPIGGMHIELRQQALGIMDVVWLGVSVAVLIGAWR